MLWLLVAGGPNKFQAMIPSTSCLLVQERSTQGGKKEQKPSVAQKDSAESSLHFVWRVIVNNFIHYNTRLLEPYLQEFNS